MVRYFLILFFFIFCALSSNVRARNHQLQWDVLIYMQADNDLMPYAIWDLLEIENSIALKNPAIRVRVLADFPGDDGYRLYQMQYTSHPNLSRRKTVKGLYLEMVHSESEVVAHEQTEQLKVLQSVIEEGFAESNSVQSMLVIWGHGEGASAKSEVQFGGVAIDQNPKSRIAITELADLLRSNKQSYDRIFDMIVFDACLMQTIEVGFELLGLTKFMLGSTQIHSFRGLPYTEVLNALTKSNAYQMAQTIPQLVQKIAHKDGLYNEKEFTMSSYQLDEMYFQFLPEFNRTLELINIQMKQTPGLKFKIKSALEKMPKFLTSSRDLGGMIGVLEQLFYTTHHQRIKNSLRQSFRALNRAVVASAFGTNYYAATDSQHLMGYTKAFGIWFPFSKQNFQQRYPDFQSLAFFRSGQMQEWDKFINYLY